MAELKFQSHLSARTLGKMAVTALTIAAETLPPAEPVSSILTRADKLMEWLVEQIADAPDPDIYSS